MPFFDFSFHPLSLSGVGGNHFLIKSTTPGSFLPLSMSDHILGFDISGLGCVLVWVQCWLVLYVNKQIFQFAALK